MDQKTKNINQFLKLKAPLGFLPLSIFLIALLFISLNCKKTPGAEPKPITEIDKLPAITTEGKNTFGCLVNGKVWLPKKSSTSAGLYGDYYNGFLYILAVENIIGESFFMNINTPIYDTGIYALYDTINRTVCEHNGDTLFYAAEDRPNALHILKLDKENKIISGTFYFEGQATRDTSKHIKVTEGRFDINYGTIN